MIPDSDVVRAKPRTSTVDVCRSWRRECSRTGEVGIGQRGSVEVRIGEVLAGEVAAAQIVPLETDSGQIVGLVAGCGVELRRRDSGSHW